MTIDEQVLEIRFTGVNILANAVKCAFDSKGFGQPQGPWADAWTQTGDGASVAKDGVLISGFEHFCAQRITELAVKTPGVAIDATASTIAPVQIIGQEEHGVRRRRHEAEARLRHDRGRSGR